LGKQENIEMDGWAGWISGIWGWTIVGLAFPFPLQYSTVKHVPK